MEKQTKITHEQKQLCKACLMLEAYIETIRPKVEAIYQDTYEHYFPKDHVKDRKGKPITEFRLAYMANEYKAYDWEGFYKEIQIRLKEEKLPPSKPGCCPLLEAEAALRDTRREFCRVCAKALPNGLISWEQLSVAPLELQREFLDINMSYVTPTLKNFKL